MPLMVGTLSTRSVTPAGPMRCRWGSPACNPISGPPGRHAAPRQRGLCQPAGAARACDWTGRPSGTLVAQCWPRRYDYAVPGQASVRPIGTCIAPRRRSRCDPANDPARDPTRGQRDGECIAGHATAQARAQRRARQSRIRPDAGGHVAGNATASARSAPRRAPPEVSRSRRLAAGRTACGSALGEACGRPPALRSSVPAPPSR